MMETKKGTGLCGDISSGRSHQGVEVTGNSPFDEVVGCPGKIHLALEHRCITALEKGFVCPMIWKTC